MAVFVMLVLVFISLILIAVILLQRGRGGGLAGAFGGMGGQRAFGTKAGDVFTKITIGLVAVWVLLAGVSGILARKGGEFANEKIGPHKGSLISLDDHEYKIELVFSAEPRELHGYLLDKAAKKEIPLALKSFDFALDDSQGGEVEIITLMANPQDDEAAELASRYTAKADDIPAEIQDLKDLEGGQVRIEIDGQKYTGDF